MELSLETTSSSRPRIHRVRRQRRAHWWFQQMRQMVERALDHEAAVPPRSEQIYFSLPRRQVACETAEEKRGLN